MNLRVIYAIILGLAGSLFGCLIAIGIAIFSFGVSYLMIFGDDPWPDWTYAVYFGFLPAGAFIGLLVAAVVMGIKIGKSAEQRPDRQKEVRKAQKLLLGVVSVWIMTVSLLFVFINESRESNEEATRVRQENIEIARELEATMHRIERVDIKEATDGFEVIVETTEGSSDAYRLDIKIVTPFEKTVFLQKQEESVAGSEAWQITNFITYQELFAKCEELVQDFHCQVGNTGAMFRVEVKLTLASSEYSLSSQGVAEFSLDYNKEGNQFIVQKLYGVEPFRK